MPDIDADTLAEKLFAKFRGASRPLDDDHMDLDGASDNARVPVSRLRSVTADNKRLREQLAELQGEVEKVKGAYQQRAEAAEKAAQKAAEKAREEAAAQVTAIAQGHAEDLELVDLGFKDPLGRNAVRDAWGRLPEPQRGASPIDWLRQQVAAAEARAAYLADPKADPAKAPAPPALPRTVAAYLPEPAKVETAKTETATRRAPAARVDESARNEAPDIRNFDPSLGVNAFLATLREGTPDGG